MSLLYANGARGHYPESWYAASAQAPSPYPALSDKIEADVAVVGGGFTGLSAALHLARSGAKVVLLEAQRVGWGASGRNGGQVAPGLVMHQDALEARLGRAVAEGYWRVGQEAVALVRKLCHELAPETDWQPGVMQACWKPGEVKAAFAYADFLRREYGCDTLEDVDKAALPRFLGTGVYAGGVVDWSAGHIHPLAFAFGLARGAASSGAVIHEGTEVKRIAPKGAGVILTTEQGQVQARDVVLACNGYIGGLDKHVAARSVPLNNYLIATEPLGARAADVMPQNVAVADTKFVINYFRMSNDGRLIFGGGESYGYTFPADIATKVRKPMERIFPQLKGVKITHGWGGTLAITAKRVPIFARPQQGIWSASGYSGHGVALGTQAGKIIAEAIGGRADDFELMAKLPTPAFPGGTILRTPLATAAMLFYAMRDRIGL